nr:MAG TPA: hypothetical protein [Caudoviricetes sp.]
MIVKHFYFKILLFSNTFVLNIFHPVCARS